MTMWRGSGPVDPNRPVVAPTKVLLTGATGFIGRHVLANLLAQGIIVRTVGRRPPFDVNPGLIEHVPTDITQDFSAAAEGCDCIIHLAGLSDASASIDRPIEFATTNVTGTLRALEAARRHRTSIVVASSQRVYRPSVRPLSEEAALGPIDPYGETKLQVEEWTDLYARLYGVRGTILRLFSVYGPGQVSGQTSGVVSILLRTAREGSPLRVRARQLRDFVDVRDVVRAIDLAIKHPPDTVRIYNIGTGQPTSVAELGELVRKVVGTTVPLIVDLSPNPESYVADPRRAAAEIGFQSEIELYDGLVWYNRHLGSRGAPFG
jgi:UDP-glucose 4-epimerase